MWLPRVAEFIDTGVEWWLPGTEGGGHGELLFNRWIASVLQDEKVLMMDSDDGWTTRRMNVLNTTELYT